MKGKMTFLVLFLSAHVGTVGAQSAAQIEALETRINEQQRQFEAMREEQQRQLDAMREELHLYAKNAGAMVGPITLTDSGDEIDCSRMGVYRHPHIHWPMG